MGSVFQGGVVSDEDAVPRLRVARGPVLQVHPADREQSVSLPARQGLEVPVRLRNVGTEPLTLAISGTAPWVEVLDPSVTLSPGETARVRFRIPPLALEPGSYSFSGVLRGEQLLGDHALVRVALDVTEPVSLIVAERGEASGRAWEPTWLELEVRRSDGRPCTVAAVSADPWPHWILRSEIHTDLIYGLVRLQCQAPGRGAERSAEITITATEPGIEPKTHRVRLTRRSGPLLVWGGDPSDPLTAEKVARDDPEWAEQGLTLPDLLPGDTGFGSFRVRNAGYQPAVARVRVEPADPARAWLEAGFGPEREPGAVTELSLQPGQEVTVRTRLRPPLPLDRWVKDAAGRTRRGRTPASELSWPGAIVRIEAEGAPLVLAQRVSASVLGALQPVPPESRVLPAAIDLGLSLFGAGLVYVAGWTLLGDYGLARLSEPVMAALHARFYSLAGGLALVLWWLLYALLLAGCQGLYGTTPGKAYAGMELRRPDGSPIPRGKAALRGLLTALFLPLVCWAAALQPARGNPLDRLLGTRVVRVVSLWDEA